MSVPIDKHHVQVTLADLLADHLLKKRTLCLAFKACPIKFYVTIQRCHRCQDFDDIAAESRNQQVSGKCARNHKYEEHRSRKELCTMCEICNYENRGHLKAPLLDNHSTYSGQFKGYRKLLKRSDNWSQERVSDS